MSDRPDAAQLEASELLHGRARHLGLYEGVPLLTRSVGFSGVAPDVITIFRVPHVAAAGDGEDLQQLVHTTVWHEVAHYFGLDHNQIAELE